MSTVARREIPKSDPAEQWLPVVGFEGRYEVSDQGRVWSCVTNRILRPAPTSRGYLSVQLYFDASPKRGKSYCVHDLVATAFIGPKPEGLQVDHGKRGKLCNALTNLEYVTPQENIRRAESAGLIPHPQGAAHANAKLTWEQAREIRKRGRSETRSALAIEFEVSANVIRDIVLQRSYRKTSNHN